jgi:hypothetical protein
MTLLEDALVRAKGAYEEALTSPSAYGLTSVFRSFSEWAGWETEGDNVRALAHEHSTTYREAYEVYVEALRTVTNLADLNAAIETATPPMED